jgi:hypothetical protein
MTTHSWLFALAGISLAALSGCTPDEITVASDAGDGGNLESSVPDADGAAPLDAGPEADVVQPTVYNDFTKLSSWSTFDTAVLPGSPGGFFGGTFDGKYLYFAPYFRSDYGGKAVRYDTTAPFGNAGSWTSFDIASVNSGLVGFRGAAVTPNHVYYVPNTQVGGAKHGLLTRYDRSQPFNQGAAWSYFDMPQLSQDLRGYAGAVVAKGALYLVPEETSNVDCQGRVVRYDLNGSFSAPSSYSVHDPAGFAWCFQGGVFDGRYIYFIPNFNGKIARYDTNGPFESKASWELFELSIDVDPKATTYAGAVFDGRYVYLAPGAPLTYTSLNKPNSLALRYDTTQPFASPSSWEKLDLAANIHPDAFASIGAAFDGRYVYLASLYTGLTVRYDTQGAFTAPASWESFDVSKKLDPKAHYFAGILFDGAHVYFVPCASGSMVVRFDAKSPPSMPPSFAGSTL